MKLQRYTIDAQTDTWWGDTIAILEVQPSKQGDWIRKDELLSWLQMHLQIGKHENIYTELITQLGD